VITKFMKIPDEHGYVYESEGSLFDEVCKTRSMFLTVDYGGIIAKDEYTARFCNEQYCISRDKNSDTQWF